MSTPETVTREMAPVPPPPPAVESNGGEEASILSGLRVEHKATVAATTKVFEVPGWGTQIAVPGHEGERTPLAVEYGVAPYPERRALVVRLNETSPQDPFREMNYGLDNIIQAARSVGVIVGGEFVPFSKSSPVGWGSDRLIQALGVTPDGPTARAKVLAVFGAVFGPERAPYHVIEHAGEVNQWIEGGDSPESGAAAEADGEFAKNS